MKKRLLMSPLFLALAGCTNLWFPYEKPATETPAAWREATPTSTETSWPDQPWWELFGTPELVQLVKTAQEKNHDLGAAIARVRQANAQVTINGAPLLPTVAAAADGAHTHAGSMQRSKFSADTVQCSRSPL